MSPRHNRRSDDGRGPRPDFGAGVQRVETWPDGDWMVRAVTGAATGKTYRCPGCDQQIPPGVAHLVTWPADPIGTDDGMGRRRHWHQPCWQARDRRRANVQRSRNAPRYG